jgi:N-methylhydantoinase A
MDRARAEAAVGVLAGAMGLGLRETAEAIIRVSISNMFVEVNKLIGRYGVDPGDFCLMPFGGAGPMLGCLLARELGIRRVTIPRRPGVVSALGGLIADVKNDFVSTVFLELAPEAAPALGRLGASLQADAETWLREEQRFEGPATTSFLADMRYVGQSFEIEVPIEAAWIVAGDIAAIAGAFHRQHIGIYDFADETAEVQIVNLRLVIAGVTTPPEFPALPLADAPAMPIKQVDVWYDGASRPMPIYLREALLHGHALAGPAIIVQEDTTICIPEGFAGEVDSFGNLHLVWQERLA